MSAKDIVGSTFPITTSDKKSQIATKSVGVSYAQAFQRLQWLVVSWECVEMACAFHLMTNFMTIWRS